MRAEGLTRYDLSYGDFVLYKGITTKVVGVMVNGYEYVVVDKEGYPYDVYSTKNDLKPIPLTPEMLVDDFGFTDGEFYAELLLHDEANTQIQCDCMNIRIRNPWRELVNIFCGSVHELQHALRLCNIDIEIGL